MKLAGRSAIITGASQGLGFEIAKQFVREGANVMLCARHADQLQSAQQELLQILENHNAHTPISDTHNHSPKHHSTNKVLAQVADVSNPEEIAHLTATALREFGRIDILVANAGIYGPKGSIEEIDWNEWSRAIDINLKGTVLQCRALLPHFKQNQYGKIIILSGGGATKPLPFLSAYAASKAGVVRFAETLAEEVKSFHIDVNSVAPGALNTRLLDEVLAAGPEKVGHDFYQQSLKQKQNGGTALDVGASLCVFLASDESDGITGRLISAVWDSWHKLPDRVSELNQSDIYTLRRIVPDDRGKQWETTV